MTKYLWYLLCSIAFLWLLTFVQTVPFDFDEALYRRAAEEMLVNANWLQPTWDGIPFFDKPPTYLWTIMLSSQLFRDELGQVSNLAARFPSWFFSIISFLMLGFSWKKNGESELKALEANDLKGRAIFFHGTCPGFLYSLALIPAVGSALVLLDPMLSAALVPSFLVFNKYFCGSAEGFAKVGVKDGIIVAISLTIATMIKGLVGFVIPGFALFVIFLYEYFFCTRANIKAKLFSTFTFMPYFVAAIILSFLFYGMIWMAHGETFVREFFLTHHFLRGSHAMEGHTGSFLYHPVIVIFGGFILSGIIWIRLLSCGLSSLRRREFVVPVSWTLAFILFFSLMATKLPNYTWPVWPSLVWIGCLLIIAPNREKCPSQFGLKIPSVILIFIGLVFCCIPIILTTLPFPVDPRAKLIINSAPALDFMTCLSCLLGGSACFYLAYIMPEWVQPNKKCLLNSVAAVALLICSTSLGILPYADLAFAAPLRHAISYVDRLHRPINLVGLSSPSASSAHSGPAKVSRFSANDSKAFVDDALVVIPVWKANFCTENGFVIVKTFQYIDVCSRP